MIKKTLFILLVLFSFESYGMFIARLVGARSSISLRSSANKDLCRYYKGESHIKAMERYEEEKRKKAKEAAKKQLTELKQKSKQRENKAKPKKNENNTKEENDNNDRDSW